MIFTAFNSLPAWAMLLVLAMCLAAGLLLGVLYFRSLWWSVRGLTGGDRVTTMIALTIGRFVLLGGVLTMASFAGALPLLVTALGFLIARSVETRRIREATS